MVVYIIISLVIEFKYSVTRLKLSSKAPCGTRPILRARNLYSTDIGIFWPALIVSAFDRLVFNQEKWIISLILQYKVEKLDILWIFGGHFLFIGLYKYKVKVSTG